MTQHLASHGLFGALRRVLADGAWHDFETLVDDLQDLIPPEIASRYYLGNRVQRDDAWPRHPAAIRRALRQGRHYVISQALREIEVRGKRPLALERVRAERNRIVAVRLVPP